MAYFDKYGVEFSDDRKTLVHCPIDYVGEYIIPNSVTSIENDAFYNCRSLTSVKIPNSVTSIGDYAFHGCSGLKSIEIPNSVTSIGNWVFEDCSNIRSVTIPNSVTSIGYSAFAGCSGLTSVTIPNSVTSIGGWAFSGCSGLTRVEIPDSVTEIGSSAFKNCFGLPIEDNLRYADTYLVEAVDKSLLSCTIREGTKWIGSGAFENCSSLRTVTIPNSLICIGCAAFSNCIGLAKIEIPNSVCIIEGFAFQNCSDLTSVEIPDSVTEIECFAFDDCSSLKSINIPSSVTSIELGAFSSCHSLTKIRIPNSVTSIKQDAFNCSGLTSVVIPDGITSIGKSAFYKCRSLTSVKIPNSVTSIGDYAFDNCKNLTEISVPLEQEERFCQMEGLKDFAEIIRKTSEKQKEQLRQRAEIEQQRLQIQQEQEMLQDSTLFFDTETTGVPRNYKAPVSDSYNWPRLVQLAWMMVDKNGNVLKQKSVIIKPDGFSIPSDASAVHGITTERAQREGQPLNAVMEEFMNDVQLAASVVGHNIDFDMHIVGAELYRHGMDYNALMSKPCTCTMKSSTDFCAIPNPNTYFGGYKWPSLQELYRKLFNRDFTNAHDALAATKECFFELRKRGIIGG